MSKKSKPSLAGDLFTQFSEPSVKAKVKPPHVIVKALAGTGKSSTIVEGLKVLYGMKPAFKPSPQQKAVWDQIKLSKGAKRVGFCAFGKDIAEELKTRMPEDCEALTLNALGNRIVTAAFGRMAVTDETVYRHIADLMKLNWEYVKKYSGFGSIAARIIGLCKQTMVDHLDDSLEDSLDELVERYGVELEGHRAQVYALVPQVMERCKNPRLARMIDYDDQVWLPVVLKLPVQKYDLLFCDEIQDLDRASQELALMCGHRIIGVGDENQSLYAFKGADTESMKRMEKRLVGDTYCKGSHTRRHIFGPGPGKNAGLIQCIRPDCGILEDEVKSPGCMVLPLTVTFRCGRAIVKNAQQYVPEFEAHELNCEGKVTRLPRYDEYDPHAVHWLDLVKPGDMVLCPMNSPLLGPCLRLISRRIKAEVLGRNIGSGIILSIRKLCKNDDDSAQLLMERARMWFTERTKPIVLNPKRKKDLTQTQIAAAKDRRDCILALAEGKDTVGEVVAVIKAAFTDQRDVESVMFSTVHKSKGLEAERVFILPPPYQLDQSKMRPWEISQLRNLAYVAATRPISELVYVI